MNPLLKAIIILIVGNLMAWFQLQGQFLKGQVGEFMRQDWVVILMGIPIGWMFWKATYFSYQHFGALWNLRMIGFGIGTLIFGVMTAVFLNELPNWQTIISILLACVIILIQISNISNI